MKGVIHITFTPSEDPSGCNIAVKQNLEDISPFALADAISEIIATISKRSQGALRLCNLVKLLALEKVIKRDAAEAGDPDKAEEAAAGEEEATDE